MTSSWDIKGSRTEGPGTWTSEITGTPGVVFCRPRRYADARRGQVSEEAQEVENETLEMSHTETSGGWGRDTSQLRFWEASMDIIGSKHQKKT